MAQKRGQPDTINWKKTQISFFTTLPMAQLLSQSPEMVPQHIITINKHKQEYNFSYEPYYRKIAKMTEEKTALFQLFTSKEKDADNKWNVYLDRIHNPIIRLNADMHHNIKTKTTRVLKFGGHRVVVSNYFLNTFKKYNFI